jgi:hypothetical protein
MLVSAISEDPTLESRERQYLPFTVSLVATKDELARAVAVRATAFLRHNAPAADALRHGEKDDLRDDVVLLVARSKLDGGVLGTIRIQPNLRTPMHLESVISLSFPFNESRCVEFIRLGVLNGSSGRLVSFALAKASYEICRATQMDYIFVCSRAPVDTMYRRYMFDDFLEGRKLELHYAPGVPHTVLCLPVAEAEERWRLRSPQVHKFFVETDHPDLRVDYAAVTSRFAAPKPAMPVASALVGTP